MLHTASMRILEFYELVRERRSIAPFYCRDVDSGRQSLQKQCGGGGLYLFFYYSAPLCIYDAERLSDSNFRTQHR